MAAAEGEMLARRSKGRITLRADLFSDGVLVGTFEGVYVALRPA